MVLHWNSLLLQVLELTASVVLACLLAAVLAGGARHQPCGHAGVHAP
jgi:hypothetical protein